MLRCSEVSELTSFHLCIISTDNDRCLQENTTVPPILQGCINKTIIGLESIVFKCTFKGNYNRLQPIFDTFWTIKSPPQRHIRLNEGNISSYYVTTYPDCITDSKSLCCQFTTELHINSSMYLDRANVSCWADIRNSSNSYNAQRVLYSSAKLG